MSLAVDPALLAALRDLAAAAYPNEACALLVGTGGRISRIVPAANVAAEPRRRFEVDPAAQLRLRRELRGGGEELMGVWHSHPDGFARPSAADCAAVLEPDLVWLITAWPGGDTAAFRLRQDGYERLELA